MKDMCLCVSVLCAGVKVGVCICKKIKKIKDRIKDDEQ